MYGLSAKKSGRCREVAVVEVESWSLWRASRCGELVVSGGSTVFLSDGEDFDVNLKPSPGSFCRKLFSVKYYFY